MKILFAALLLVAIAGGCGGKEKDCSAINPVAVCFDSCKDMYDPNIHQGPCIQGCQEILRQQACITGCANHGYPFASDCVKSCLGAEPLPSEG